MSKIYRAYYEQYKMWQSNSNLTRVVSFPTKEQAQKWLDSSIDKVSDSDDLFLGDYGIEEIDFNAVDE